MKLYTEEQVRKAINDGSLYSYINGDFEFKNSEDDIINALIPIELPSDEEVINKFNTFISTEVSLKFLTKEQGERLKWYYETYLVNEIQGGNNEQQ